MGNNLRSKSDRSNVGIQIPVDSAKPFVNCQKLTKQLRMFVSKLIFCDMLLIMLGIIVILSIIEIILIFLNMSN